MGAMYTNLTLRGPRLDAVLSYLNAQKISAYVAEPQPGIVVVFDELSDTQDDRIITARAAALSQQFACGALAVLDHDDDVLAYWLYENGALLDHYDSLPGYFIGEDMPPSGGDAAALCRVFGVDAAQVDAVQRILSASSAPPDFDVSPTELMNVMMHQPEKAPELMAKLMGRSTEDDPDAPANYFMAMDRYAALVKALGLPDCVVSAGFTYIARGEIPEGLSADDLKRSGAVS